MFDAARAAGEAEVSGFSTTCSAISALATAGSLSSPFVFSCARRLDYRKFGQQQLDTFWARAKVEPKLSMPATIL